MIEQGYSRASAELTSRAVMRELREAWATVSTDGGEPPDVEDGSGGSSATLTGGDR
jgi:hypothetical protein